MVTEPDREKFPATGGVDHAIEVTPATLVQRMLLAVVVVVTEVFSPPAGYEVDMVKSGVTVLPECPALPDTK